MGRSKQAPLRLLWKGRAWAVQGPRCEPAREHQENPQGLEDGDKKNLEGLEVEEDVEAKAAAQDDGGAPQERRRPSKTVRANTSCSRIWPMAGLCSDDSHPCSRPRILQPLQWGVLGLRPDAEGTSETRTMLSDALCLLCCMCARIAEQLLCRAEDPAG